MDKEKKSIGIVCSDIYMRFPEIMEEEFDDLLKFLEDEHIRCEGATDVFMDLQQENKQLRDNIRQMDNSIDKLQKQLIKEKDNWNKLKEIIKKEQDYYMYYKDNRYRVFLYKLSEKMQEIEKERNSNVKD